MHIYHATSNMMDGQTLDSAVGDRSQTRLVESPTLFSTLGLSLGIAMIAMSAMFINYLIVVRFIGDKTKTQVLFHPQNPRLRALGSKGTLVTGQTELRT